MLHTQWSFSEGLGERVSAGFGRGKLGRLAAEKRYAAVEGSVIEEVRKNLDDVIGRVLEKPLDIWLRRSGVTVLYLSALQWDFEGDQLAQETRVDEPWFFASDDLDSEELKNFPFEYSVEVARIHLQVGLAQGLKAKLAELAVGKLEALWLRGVDRPDFRHGYIGRLAFACEEMIGDAVDSGRWDEALHRSWHALQKFLNPRIVRKTLKLLPQTGANKAIDVYQFLEREDGEFEGLKKIPVLWELILRSSILRESSLWHAAHDLRDRLERDIGKKKLARLSRMCFETISSYDNECIRVDEIIDVLKVSLSLGGTTLISRGAFFHLVELWEIDLEGVSAQVFKRARDIDLATFNDDQHERVVSEIERVCFWLSQKSAHLPASIGRAKWSRLFEHARAFELETLASYKDVRFDVAPGCETAVDGCRVIPLDTPFGMLYAAHTFQNCLANHISSAADGRTRYFIVDSSNERAIVQLCFRADDDDPDEPAKAWVLENALRKCNLSVSKSMELNAEALARFYQGAHPAKHAAVEFDDAMLEALPELARNTVGLKLEGWEAE